jgi:regulator of protease activity HflC (stomatin/prohibitin superfamily)
MKGRLKAFFGKIKIWWKKFWYRYKVRIIIFLLIFAFLVAYLWNNIFISIHSGEAGVMWYRFSGGTVMDKVYGEGLHVIFPWDKLFVYSIRTKERHDAVKILTSGGLYVEMDVSYRFHPERKSSLPYLHRVWGPQFVDKFVSPEAKAAAIAVLGDCSPKELYSLNTKFIQNKIRLLLCDEFKNSYIILEDFLITRLTLPKTIKNAIERKLTQEQLLKEYNYRLKVAEKEKERKKIEAWGINIFSRISNIPILKWKGLSVTSEIARSNNTKVIVIGKGDRELPIILDAEE